MADIHFDQAGKLASRVVFDYNDFFAALTSGSISSAGNG